MGTVSYQRCQGWHDVFDVLKGALRSAGYPDCGNMTGGNGNICAIVASLTDDVGAPSGAHVNYSIDGPDRDKAWRMTLVTRNEGGGGRHSEPEGLAKVPKRHLAQGKSIYLFTERAPCATCRESLARWANTFERDIFVQFMTPYTDTDEGQDPIMRDAHAQSANDARTALTDVRHLFS